MSLTAQQPYNNVVRTALQALAGVLGGTQSLHTNSLDEALALPTEEAVTIALRTQQIIAHETGVANTVDPLAGSWFVEKLTNEIEAEALDYFRRIDGTGRHGDGGGAGLLPARDPGGGLPVPAGRGAQGAGGRRRERVRRWRRSADPHPLHRRGGGAGARRGACRRCAERRDSAAVRRTASGTSKDAARGTDNLMPPIIEALRAYATLGEMCDALREVFGEYEEPPVF